MTMQEKIAAMQTKRPDRGDVWQNDNGTWSHRYDAECQWADKIGCLTDLRFATEHHS